VGCVCCFSEDEDLQNQLSMKMENGSELFILFDFNYTFYSLYSTSNTGNLHHFKVDVERPYLLHVYSLCSLCSFS
jgi:hypothetical protein